MNFNGRKMHVIQTAANGVVGRDTIFEFSQKGNTVTASYSGGRIHVGYLVGLVETDTFRFRYCQISDESQIDGGFSTAKIETAEGGRLRLIESFEWESKTGSGENVFEEISDCSPNQQSTDTAHASATPAAAQPPRQP